MPEGNEFIILIIVIKTFSYRTIQIGNNIWGFVCIFSAVCEFPNISDFINTHAIAAVCFACQNCQTRSVIRPNARVHCVCIYIYISVFKAQMMITLLCLWCNKQRINATGLKIDCLPFISSFPLFVYLWWSPQCVHFPNMCVCVCVSMVTGILLYMDNFLSCAYHFLSFCKDLSLPWTACTHPISNCEHWQWILRWITMWAANTLANKIRWTPRSTMMELARKRLENKVAGKTRFSATTKRERLQVRDLRAHTWVYST